MEGILTAENVTRSCFEFDRRTTKPSLLGCLSPTVTDVVYTWGRRSVPSLTEASRLSKGFDTLRIQSQLSNSSVKFDISIIHLSQSVAFPQRAFSPNPKLSVPKLYKLLLHQGLQHRGPKWPRKHCSTKIERNHLKRLGSLLPHSPPSDQA